MLRAPPRDPGLGGIVLMRRFETILIVLSLIFYAWFLGHFGTAQILSYLQLAGWGLALTISLETVARLINAVGWRVTIYDCPPTLSMSQLFFTRIAGEAVDYVTPSAQLGGQFVMAMMVRHKLRMPFGLATVFISALAEVVGQIGFITIAILISLHMIPSGELLWPIIGGFAIAIALAGGFFWVQQKHPFSHLWRAATHFEIGGMHRDDLRGAADEADGLLIDFYIHHRARFFIATLCYLLAWSLGPIEIYLLLHLLHQPGSFQVALLVEGVGLLLERATFLIPAKLVSQEGGKALILAILGYAPGVGFAIGFLRRVKEMVWVLLGLLSLMVHRIFVERGQDSKVAVIAPAAEVLKVQQAQGDYQS
ncbi:MAG TPA: lysylphosphatidylglycerol synthase domain-containing protein [Candidatus Binataceae bacterium]|nr:lysylphosphatidylglycerol synthase domain-containing protein [Candidatus Binataceae bacterium]